MADNILLNVGVGGDSVAADDIGGIKHELVKLEFGADGVATMVDAANPLPVTDAAVLAKIVGTPAAILSGKTTVTTAGTRVQLASNACKSIVIKALAANTGIIYIGNVTVAAANGYELAAGDSISCDCSNLDLIYIDSSVNGEGVSWFLVS